MKNGMLLVISANKTQKKVGAISSSLFNIRPHVGGPDGGK